jgi:hypothetical protein
MKFDDSLLRCKAMEIEVHICDLLKRLLHNIFNATSQIIEMGAENVRPRFSCRSLDMFDFRQDEMRRVDAMKGG